MAKDGIATIEAEIEAIQGDLAQSLDALTERLPRPEDLTRVVAAAVGAAVGAWVLLAVVRRSLRGRREQRRLDRAVESALAKADR